MYILSSRFASFIVVAALFLTPGCLLFNSSNDKKDTMDTTVLATWWDGPRVKPGISLVVQVGSAAMTPIQMAAIVDQNGEIVLPHLLQEPVQCNGLTLDALRKKLIKAYKVFYRQPQVTVTFAPYDGKGVSPWGTITVLGEVLSPGPVNVPSTMNLTVTKAIQAAGGLRQYADKRKIRVTRSDKDGNQYRHIVDLDEIGKFGRSDKDMVLQAGDVVWVPVTWY